MISKTEGIVLGHIPYGETSIIARIYTLQHGYMSFIVNSVRSSRSKQSIAYFQPFSLLDLVIYFKPNRDLQRISEFKPLHSNLAPDIKKQAILLFLAEVLDKVLRGEQEENHSLYAFIKENLIAFKSQHYHPNFHIQFLLKLTSYLGINIESGQSIYANMNKISDHHEVEKYIHSLIIADFNAEVEANGEIRKNALEVIIQYFQHHIDGFGKVRSLKVLAQIFR